MEIGDDCNICEKLRLSEKEKSGLEAGLSKINGNDMAVRYRVLTLPPNGCRYGIEYEGKIYCAYQKNMVF